MKYDAVTAGKFRSRPNRFIAQVEIQGKPEIVHVKNTGRCRELLVPGATVYLNRSDAPQRKTRYDLIAVRKGERLINMDSQAPNRVFAEWVEQGNWDSPVLEILPEYTFGASRLDYCLMTNRGRHFVEIKGVTLEEGGVARFPDAPTERGLRHVRELQKAVEEGHEATLFFVVQMRDLQCMRLNDATDPAFGQAVRQAAAAGIRVVAYECEATPDSLWLSRPVPVIL